MGSGATVTAQQAPTKQQLCAGSDHLIDVGGNLRPGKCICCGKACKVGDPHVQSVNTREPGTWRLAHGGRYQKKIKILENQLKLPSLQHLRRGFDLEHSL